MQLAFKNANLQKEFRALNKKLMPLTLGHAYVLDMYESPFFKKGMNLQFQI